VVRTFTDGEELANSLIHGIGAALSVLGLVVLVVSAVRRGSSRLTIACCVYGTSLVFLYCCSALHHGLRNRRAKRVFLILDHVAIYLLIAGTYTPFTLVTLRGTWGWTLFGIVWGLAAVGIVYKSFYVDHLGILSTAVYLLMGWCVIIAIGPLLRVLPWQGLEWLLAGGLLYSVGVIFYASQRKHAHALWHLCVLAGSLCHYVAVYRYVVGA
jgi:hemolysin III